MATINPHLLSDGVEYVDRWLAYQQRYRQIPALQVAVRFGDDLVLSSAHGHANIERGEPATTRHLFRVASHSKWFTATAIMMLKERGALRLDDPIGPAVPWLGGPLADLTVRQLLNHASGITRDGPDNDFWQLEQPFPDRDGLRALLTRENAIIEADRMLKYSNVGYALLGMVVEHAAEMPYNRFVQEQIVDRLGLANTGPETDDEARSRLVTGYTSRALLGPHLPVPDVPTGAMSPATGFYSNAEDLTRFASAHFFGSDALLSDVSRREMQRALWQVDDMDSYGLGMQVVKIGNRWMAGHAGGFPGHTTRTYLDPQDRLAISILTSESAGIATVLTQSAVRLIDLALAQDPRPPDSSLDRFTGRFASLWSFVDVVRFGNQIFVLSPELDDPASDAFKLEIVDEDTLRIEVKPGYGSPGETVRYERDSDGAVTRVRFAGSTHWPEDAVEDLLERTRRKLGR